MALCSDLVLESKIYYALNYLLLLVLMKLIPITVFEFRFH
jgi:hypothetical protein